MKCIIAESFSDSDLKGDAQCVTPQSFSAIKDWSKFEVDGIKYYVDKAVKLGAKKAKAKPKPKPKKQESTEEE